MGLNNKTTNRCILHLVKKEREKKENNTRNSYFIYNILHLQMKESDFIFYSQYLSQYVSFEEYINCPYLIHTTVL